MPTTLVPHFFDSFARRGRLGLHVAASGEDAHHVAEAAFKAVALALREAVEPDAARSGHREHEGRPVSDVRSSTTAPATCARCAPRSSAPAPSRVSDRPDGDRRRRLVVIPGVGAARPAMEALRERGLDDAIRALRGGAHLFGVCVGLQLLFARSEEGETAGLGLLPGTVTRLDGARRLPHMGWNDVEPRTAHPLAGPFPATCYFAHSYAVQDAPTTSCSRRPRSSAARSRASSATGRRRRAVPPRALAARPARVPARRAPVGEARMLRSRIIPCLDVSGGRVVKGVNFVNLRDCGDPVEAALRYAEQGADEIVWLNITASGEDRRRCSRRSSARPSRSTCRSRSAAASDASGTCASCCWPAPTRSRSTPPRSRVPRLIERAADRFGSQCVVCAIDARRSGRRLARLRRRRPPADWDAGSPGPRGRRARRRRAAGDVDGLRRRQDGYDLELLRTIFERVDVPVVASGGAGRPEHLADALEAGAEAALAASIFHDGTHTVEEVKAACRARGLPMR